MMRAAIPFALAVTLFAAPLWAAETATPETEALPSYADAQAAVDAADWPTAQRILAQLIVAQPENADIWNLYGYTSRNMKLAGPALEAYETALKLEPGHLGALEYQGEMFVELKRLDDAKANLARLKDLCGDCEQVVDLEAAIAAAPAE
jgi:predicted Zn-dependent protease